ncbi:HAD family hydrolase [Lyngbya confervoides]|uniref:HAD family hydrolase n=1 Tax=Lyngbya confervoides BDU141951 TaxID=1574623 RepID=A0ABD4T7D0_9CYAN|nr:HAD family hydrolase [Lyngbya confervoides]MCM1984383.1 HAD family hydrolase [Lyngbya confervoides BDU141951]
MTPRSASRSNSDLTIFCDLDGPLIDVSRRYYKTYRLAIVETVYYYQAQGITLQLLPVEQDRFWHMKLERIPDRDIAARTGFRGAQIDVFLDTVRRLVNQPIMLQEDRLQTWAVEALESLTQAGASLYLVTLRERQQAMQSLKRFGIYHYFTEVYGTDDEFSAYDNYVECKAVMLSRLMESLRLSSGDEVWMIGDTEADILSAKSLGIPAIALSCGMRSSEYLRRLEPAHVFRDLSQAAHQVIYGAAAA